MKLMIVTTPYQLFNAIMYKSFIDAPMNLYVSDFCSANYDLASKIEQKGFFDNVFYIKHAGRQVEIKGNIIRDFFPRLKRKLSTTVFVEFLYKKLCSLADFETVYDEIVLDCMGIMQKTVVKHFKKINPTLRVSMIEVGLESYIKANNIDRGINKKFFIDKLHIYGGDMYENKSVIKKLEINKSIKKDIDYIFGDSKASFDSYDNIYLDQLLDNPQNNFTKTCFNDILNALNGASIVKYHPRRKTGFFEGAASFSENTTFEIIVGNSIGEYKDKVLVGLHSMALATPKLLYDYEPYILCLCELNPYKTHEHGYIYDFFVRLKNLYTDKDKVFIPRNTEELEQAIKIINQRRVEL